MPDNKIQDIANEITAYKPNTTLSLVKAVLEDLNAPFPEETKFYLKKLFGNISVAYGTGVNINVVTEQDDNYILTFSGQPFSYIEINDTVYRFPESGSLTVTVKQDAENPFPYAKILWVPMNKNLPEGYEKPEESKYLENCSKYFTYPMVDDSEHRNKNYVKIGYIFYENPSELLFSNNVSIYPDQNDPRILKVSGLLPNKKYEINGVKFTADSGGIATIEDGVRLAETFDELKEFGFDGNKVNLQKNDYGYNTEINKYVYVIDNVFKTLEETDESGAVDLINSQNLPKNISGLQIIPFAQNKQYTITYNYNITSGVDKIKSVNSIKVYKKNGSYHLIINYNTESQDNLIFKIGEHSDFIDDFTIEAAIGFVIKGTFFNSL